MRAAGNAASLVVGAVFKWERLLVGERRSMPFYAEAAAQLLPPDAEDQLPASKEQEAAAQKRTAAAVPAGEGVDGVSTVHGCISHDDVHPQTIEL